MVVLTKSHNKLYRLTELDGTISKLRYVAFCLVPYHSHTPAFIPLEELLSPEDLLLLNDNSTGVEEDA